MKTRIYNEGQLIKERLAEISDYIYNNPVFLVLSIHISYFAFLAHYFIISYDVWLINIIDLL